MSDLIRFICILFFGVSVSMLIFMILGFPSFSPDSRQRASRFTNIILLVTVLFAFVYCHMFDHVLHFLDFIVNS